MQHLLHSACVLDRSGDKLAVFNHSLEHLWHWLLSEDTLLFSLDRQIDIDGTALRGRDFNTEAILREEYLTGVGRV